MNTNKLIDYLKNWVFLTDLGVRNEEWVNAGLMRENGMSIK